MNISIYRKFLLGIITAMISVFLVSLTVFLQTQPTDSVESQIYPLIYRMETVFNLEVAATSTYLKSREVKDWEKLDFLMGRFKLYADSCSDLSKGTPYEKNLDEILKAYHSFQEITSRVSPVNNKNYILDSLDWKLQNEIADTVCQTFLNTYLTFRPNLSSIFEKNNSQKSTQPLSIVAILVVIIVITWIIARPYAQSLTRPIKALREGTQKVGEGKYESVPVTSKDEIADLTRAFNMMSEKLRKLDEMRMEMMSEISHEMRTPLQVIKAGCYSIIHAKDSSPLTPRQRDAVGMIHQATNRINSFINLFLDVAKMESGLMKFNFEDSDVLQVLTPLIQEAELIAQTRQIKLEFIKEEVPNIPIDRDRLSQAFSNLLSNALKYTPNDGTITVTVLVKDKCNISGLTGERCLQIDVKDTGVGIPEEDLGKLFSKFYQAKNVPLVNEKGSGLGLVLVKHVVEAHGGKVSVQSTVGVGSTFSIYLPVGEKVQFPQ